MAGRNQKVIDKAFKGYAQHIDKVVYNELDKFCMDILRKAIWERQHVAFGHNFTGNLINSIVVILYRKSTGTKTSYFGYDKQGLKLPIRRELSRLNSRGNSRKNRIFFRPGSKFGREDWTGQWSSIKASTIIPTDESWGQNDAIQFASNWLPSNPNLDFVICVAYTAEYASFVEHERHTTGYLSTLDYTERTAVELYNLKPAA